MRNLTPGLAAARLVQLLAADAIGDLVDVIGDAGVRDALLSAMHRCRGITSDELAAAALSPPGKAA